MTYDALMRGIRIGYLFGFAGAMWMAREIEPRTRKQVSRPEDQLVADYVKSKTIVYMSDIAGFVGIDETKGNKISLGNAMKRLGWVRRRHSYPDNRWFYERGEDAKI